MRGALSVLLLATACCVEAATLHVAQEHPNADDANAGTVDAPLETINAAIGRARPGDTVLVGKGTYREEVVWQAEDPYAPMERMTLAAAGGARPVVKGSEVATGWEQTAGDIHAADWETPADIVFADGDPLTQIGLQGNPKRAASTNGFQWKRDRDGNGIADMRPGSFHYNADAKRLHVWLADGSDPADHLIEVGVRGKAVQLSGTWTLRGFDITQVADGFWPDEQAVSIGGKEIVVEDCRITHNGFVGLIASGEDCIIRNNELAYNGLMGFTSNSGHRMLVEGNEFHHNATRGDVKCLSSGNKWVQWREAKFLRYYFHDETATALWCDINVNNALIAENRFENCNLGIYFEISRWGVIANNVLRNCGRAIWVYSSDVLVAHNVIDSCGEGITVSGYPRHAAFVQSVREQPYSHCLMSVRNNLIVDNLLIDCPGSYIGITESTPYGWANWSDHNAFVWTLPAFHRSGMHINCMSGWDTLYGKLPIWRMKRHCDTRSVAVDAKLLEEVRGGSPWVQLSEDELFADAGLVDRAAGDYHLTEDSPLRGRGIELPTELASSYQPGQGQDVVSRAWEATAMKAAPDPDAATPVHGDENGHYRLQPLPRVGRLVDLDAMGPGTPGLNETWADSGQHPRFRDAAADVAGPAEWAVRPENLVSDSGFDEPMGEDSGWIPNGGWHSASGMACANLAPNQTAGAIAKQQIGVARAGGRYVMYGDVNVSSRDQGLATVARMYIAAGPELKPVGAPIEVRAEPGQACHWDSRATEVVVDGREGEALYIVIDARMDGAAESAVNPAGFARWDDVWVLGN